MEMENAEDLYKLALMLADWNDTRRDYPQDQTIHQLFEAQVERIPDATAVRCEERQLTYRELNRRANQWAHHLQTLGVGPEVLVGICMERSPELLIGLLGILKAGGAYVPLDPAYPQARLAFMLEDSRVPVLLTREQLLEGLPRQPERVVCLDTGSGAVARESEQNPATETMAENLAYVIYTSGSTGSPKGVMISHRAVLNTICWLQETFELDSRDIIAQKTSMSFTDSVWEFFWPLTVGSTIAILSDDSVKDQKLFYRDLRDSKVTITQFVPALMAIFLETVSMGGETNPLPHLKWVFNGGEALTVQGAQEWCSLFQHAKIANIYGMTESAIYATSYIVERYREYGKTGMPIGKPIANASVYILNEDGQLCPAQSRGEICIGGVSLSRGYLDRPEMTAAKFIPNPFSDEPGARLYKTGDQGCFLPNGNLQFLGRIDHQVKIRGFRIELGEVEAALGQHPAVQQAVVVAREDKPVDKRLVAYILPNRGLASTTGELRSFLQKTLPKYMVPSAFVLLDALPLTPNGKIDRGALPTPDRARPALERALVPPRTPLECLIAEIWRDLLGVDRVSVHDNFFDLGGHSLLSMQLIASLEKKLGLQIHSREVVFQTLGQLATACEEQMRLLQTSVSMSLTQRIFYALKSVISPRPGAHQ
jgi:amino acid adenylation domain-containing protein